MRAPQSHRQPDSTYPSDTSSVGDPTLAEGLERGGQSRDALAPGPDGIPQPSDQLGLLSPLDLVLDGQCGARISGSDAVTLMADGAQALLQVRVQQSLDGPEVIGGTHRQPSEAVVLEQSEGHVSGVAQVLGGQLLDVVLLPIRGPDRRRPGGRSHGAALRTARCGRSAHPAGRRPSGPADGRRAGRRAAPAPARRPRAGHGGSLVHDHAGRTGTGSGHDLPQALGRQANSASPGSGLGRSASDELGDALELGRAGVTSGPAGASRTRARTAARRPGRI